MLNKMNKNNNELNDIKSIVLILWNFVCKNNTHIEKNLLNKKWKNLQDFSNFFRTKIQKSFYKGVKFDDDL